MGRALHRLWYHAHARLGPSALALILVLLWLPALVDNLRSAPLQLGQYASWMGGPRGAARMGLNRGFWGGLCVPQALRHIGQDQTLYPHDMHPWLWSVYQRAPQAPASLRIVPRNRAQLGFHFYERHFLGDELATLKQIGPLRWVCPLDDVPLMSIHATPESKGQ